MRDEDEMPRWVETCLLVVRPIFKLLKPFHVTLLYDDGSTRKFRLSGFENKADTRFVNSTHAIMRTSFWHRRYSVLCERSHILIGDFADLDAAIMYARMVQDTTMRRV